MGVAQVLRSGRGVVVPEISDEALVAAARDDAHLEMMRRLGARSAMLVPLPGRDAPIGCLTFIAAESGKIYDADDFVLAQALAERAAHAVINSRLYRRAQEAVRARDDFVAAASHELRTPLTSLDLKIHALRSQWIAGGASSELAWLESGLQLIERQSARLRRLIDQLLDISRLAGGRIRLEPEELELGEVVRDVVGLLHDSAEVRRAGSELRVDIEPGIVGRWDRLRVEQIVTNLLSNALKYGAGKPIDVVVRRRDGSAVLIVADHGIGIAPEAQAKIFGRFERAASLRHYGGLGLGLYIVRQLMELMGGTIEVSSAPGLGATFTAELPLGAAEQAATFGGGNG
jgi:signal transduction histidine kinase